MSKTRKNIYNIEQFNFKKTKPKTIKYKTVKYKQSNIHTPEKIVDGVNLEPFQSNLDYHNTNKQLIKTNDQIKTQFIKELLTPFSPSSIKPTSNFYNYINYLLLKNTKLSKKQKNRL
jgi:hypothetical protein